MDRFVELTTFVAVIDSGSLSGAANRLSVAVSAVSRRLTELESRLGVTLANRSTRGLAPTSAGREYYTHAVALLDAFERADRSVSGGEAALGGTLRVAVPLSYGLNVVAPELHRFAAERPGIRLDVDYSDRRVDLIEEGIDVAVRIGELADSNLVARRLADIRHVVAASPEYWERVGRRPTKPDELAELDGLCYRARGSRQRWSWIDPAGSPGAVGVRIRYSSSNGDALVAAAEQGLGVLCEPDFIARAAIAAGKLEVVLPNWAWMPMSAWIVLPQGRQVSPRARDLVERLAQRLGDSNHAVLGGRADGNGRGAG